MYGDRLSLGRSVPLNRLLKLKIKTKFISNAICVALKPYITFEETIIEI